MLPDTGPNPSTPAPEEPEIEVIPPDQADAILQEALLPYLQEGWSVIHRGPYNTRLTRNKRNLDIRVDLLGKVEMVETDLTPLQESGRLIAWMLLLVSLLAALVVGTALGII